MTGLFWKRYFALILFLASSQLFALDLELPSPIVEGVSYQIPVTNGLDTVVEVNGNPVQLEINNNDTFLNYTFTTEKQLIVQNQLSTYQVKVSVIPLWLSVIPPLLAILLALITREVLTSLFIGLFSGAAIIGWYTKGFEGVFTGFFVIFETYIIDALADRGHLSIVVFSMTIGAIVALISKNGGMQGVVNSIGKYAKDAKSGQLATYFLGLAIFFDDYANTLVVGNTMRAITDKLHISREKLAYIVDSTAAPIAALAFVTTWIGAELGYIEEGIANIPEVQEGAYSIFLNSLSYSFYPILTLIFILILILKGKDYGPMLKVENKARKHGVTEQTAGGDTDELSLFTATPNASIRAFNAIIPILIVILGTLAGLGITGYDEATWQGDLSFLRKISITIGNSDSYIALLWSSSAGLVSAVLLTVFQRIMSLEKTMATVISGYKTMVTAMMILVLAWSLAGITETLQTAEFLKGLWHKDLSPVLLPAITFILSALVSFSTGSSWGTMAILYPLLLPTGFTICLDAGYDITETLPLFYNLVSCILAGSVLGDHCSPISDTTILSSLSAGCNHIEHVRTQLPYALTVGGVSLLIGTIGTSLGSPIWLSFMLSIAMLWLMIELIGKKVN